MVIYVDHSYYPNKFLIEEKLFIFLSLLKNKTPFLPFIRNETSTILNNHLIIILSIRLLINLQFV